MVVAMMTLLSGLAIWNGYLVDRGDVERRRAEGILHRREQELGEAERMAQVGSWWWDPKTGQRHLVRGTFPHYGARPRCCPRRHTRSTSDSTRRRVPRASMRPYKTPSETGAPYELDLEMVRADGAIRSVTSRGEVERDADGQVVLVRGTVHDVTERKQAENEIRLLARLQAAVPRSVRRRCGATTPARCWTRPSLWSRRLSTSSIAKCWSLLPDGKALLLRSGVGWKQGLVGHATVGAGTDSQAGYTLLSDQPVIVEDLRTETRFSGSPLFARTSAS